MTAGDRGDDTLDPSGPTLSSPDTVGTEGDKYDLATMPTGNARYVMRTMLGRGGMGDVLLATDAQIGRDVAVKRMRDRRTTSVTRFLREARIQGRLDHPAIVPVHEVAVDAENRPYFVMKRLTGTTLADILAARSHVSLETSSIDKHPLSRLLRAFSDVCLAVEFAHTRGVIHRDLKPANIMLGDFGEVYVLDWGVARVIDDADAADGIDSLEVEPSKGPIGATEAGTVLGTIGYMPPEQLRGMPIDRRADVYALGCILFEILAGQPLHKPGELTAVFEAYEARPSVRTPARDVPPELEGLVVRATAPQPENRPRTARDLSDHVQRYLDGDRDVALRRRLAREQLVAARGSLIDDDSISMTTSQIARKPPDPGQRRAAMQHAGRALALDPSSTEAAALVGRIMLEPPRESPPEVEAELDTIDNINFRSQARIAYVAFLSYLAFIPPMIWVGLTDVRYLTAVGTMTLLNAMLAYALSRERVASSRLLLYGIVASNVALIAILSRMFTPFVVAPGLATATILAFAMHRQFGKLWVLATALTLGVLSSWFLELAGILPKTVAALDGALVVASPAGDLRIPNFEVAHAFYTVVLISTVGVLVRTLAKTQRDARRAAYLHAWHLRQLVPTATTTTG